MAQNTGFPILDSHIIHASQENFDDLLSFFDRDIRIHRHLDWFGPLDWLGSQPYLIEIAENRILAVLCAARENETFAWIRAFGIQKSLPITPYWTDLLSTARQDLLDMGAICLGALGLSPWFERLLLDSGFQKNLDIIVLAWDGQLPSMKKTGLPIKIRAMEKDDISMVKKIDQLAFGAPWQNAKEGLLKAFEQPGINTVAVINDAVVGYQISTTMTIYGHLARLAVLPELQHQGLGYALVYDLLERLNRQGLWRITVNTQSDNLPSLHLYNQLGFVPTGEKIPVYELVL